MRWKKEGDCWVHQGDWEIVPVNQGQDAKGGIVDKHGHHWWFEVNFQGKYKGKAPTLAKAKELCRACS